jgi:transcriptional regulator with XRE-family HTH domain
MVISNPLAAANEALRINLLVLRAKSGFSQAMLAKRTGVSRAIISELEQGRGDARLTTLSRLAKGLDATVSDLLQPWHPQPPTEDELNRRAHVDEFIDADALLAALDESDGIRRFSLRGRQATKAKSTT